MRHRKGHGLTLVTLACLSLLGSLPAIAAPSVQAGFSPQSSWFLRLLRLRNIISG